MFCMRKLEWCGYPSVKKFEDMITRFDTIHERDMRQERLLLHIDLCQFAMLPYFFLSVFLFLFFVLFLYYAHL